MEAPSLITSSMLRDVLQSSLCFGAKNGTASQSYSMNAVSVSNAELAMPKYLE
jgi:hypothetical protein